MPDRLIETRAGNLLLTPASLADLKKLARRWRLPLLRNAQDRDCYGLVFQMGEDEVVGLKMQFPDCPIADALGMADVLLELLYLALPRYLERGHRGLLIPCPYLKSKGPGKGETGIAFFVGPDPSSEDTSSDELRRSWDAMLGAGATPMLQDMMELVVQEAKEQGVGQLPIIDLDIRPRRALGGMARNFLINGPDVVAVREQLDEQAPDWPLLVQLGYRQVVYMPLRYIALAGKAAASDSSPDV